MAQSFDAALGRTETSNDTLDLRQARHFQLTLDHAPDLKPGDALPPFWHYLYFNPQIRASDLGPDGHETLGRFIPDFGLPRRMWAGGRVEIAKPLLLGEAVCKTSTIRSIEEKSGRSGRLCFVTVDHDFSVEGQHRLTETQRIVYRDPPDPDAPPPPGKPAPEPEFSRVITPDPVLLFRYSALIFYGHRIHYDADYTRDVEGYPGLLVHGPLTATLLTGFGCEQMPGRRLASFDIRAMEPLFAGNRFTLEGVRDGDTIRMWARTPRDTMALTVDLHFA